MDDKELNRQISQARSSANRKLARIAKREKFSAPVIRTLNPNRNMRVSDMNHGQKVEYLNTLKKFNSKDTNYFRDAHGNIITGDLWREYKRVEREANSFVAKDLKKYGKIKLPLSDMTVQRRMEFMVPNPGVVIANPSGTGMFQTNRKPSDVVVNNLPNLISSLQERLDKNYIRDKGLQGRDQFEKMMDVIGDADLIQKTRNLTEEQFWALWNYTEFPRQVSLNYELLMEGLRTGKMKDFALSVGAQASSVANTYVDWASKI